ncbi:MAG: YkgJ family cysteine cluster protein, partial [Candidatus Gastranaerophilales bacterium]|nr:YkgJ family cysteine cluster protein [Candidatus Gastranaerophilales bacterium]
NNGMDYTSKDLIARRPQRLCRQCGKCCRVVVALISHDELVRKASKGDKSSMEFLELFEPYNSYKDAMLEDKSIVLNIPDYENKTFYKCRFLNDDNLCSRYETRLEVCRIFPSSPWTVLPPDCGFVGWLFVEREAHKKKIRKLKEGRLYYQTKIKTNITRKEKQLYQKLINKIDERIKLYDKFGSKDW